MSQFVCLLRRSLFGDLTPGCSEEESGFQTPSLPHPLPHQLQKVSKSNALRTAGCAGSEARLLCCFIQTDLIWQIWIAGGASSEFRPSASPWCCPGGGGWGPGFVCWAGPGQESRLWRYTLTVCQVSRLKLLSSSLCVDILHHLSAVLVQVQQCAADWAPQHRAGRKHSQTVLPEAAAPADPGLCGVWGSVWIQEPGSGRSGWELGAPLGCSCCSVQPCRRFSSVLFSSPGRSVLRRGLSAGAVFGLRRSSSWFLFPRPLPVSVQLPAKLPPHCRPHDPREPLHPAGQSGKCAAGRQTRESCRRLLTFCRHCFRSQRPSLWRSCEASWRRAGSFCSWPAAADPSAAWRTTRIWWRTWSASPWSPGCSCRCRGEAHSRSRVSMCESTVTFCQHLLILPQIK